MSHRNEQTLSNNLQRPLLSIAGLLLCTISLLSPIGFAQTASTGPLSSNESMPLVFTHVTVIDTTGGPSRTRMTVVVTGTRITALGEARKVKIPKGAQIVNATGKFLIPGLWDMHAHVAFTASMMEQRYPLLIANGVTGIRDMGSSLDLINQWRKEIADGKLLGPRIAAAGPILDGPESRFKGWPDTKPGLDGNFFTIVSTPAQARQDVDALKQDGANFIKVYDFLPRDVYYAIAEEAKKRNIPFAGHVPYSVTPEEASDAGQKSIEHLTGIILAGSSREAELRKQWAEMPKPAPVAFSTYSTFSRVEASSIESYSQRKAEQLFALFVKNGTWQCPTLTVLRNTAFYFDPHFTPEFVNDPRLKYMSPTLRKMWDPNTSKFKRTAEEYSIQEKIYRKKLEIVGAMQRTGIGLLAGTDMGNAYVFPGFSLHDEMELMVEAGLTPMQALQTATINPARYLGREKELGTVGVGKLADLVLLDADPLADIRNTQQIDAVVVNGRLLKKDDLQKMLAKVEALNQAK